MPAPSGRPKAIWWVLIVPFLALLFPGWYAHADPPLFGMPFFYWYQFAVLIVTAALTSLVVARTR